MPIDSTTTSSYLQDLPAIFSEDPSLGRFLLAFEQILTGLEEADGEPQQGLEDIIGRIHTYFDPKPGETPEATERAPAEFLPWLASWVALTLREDWDEEEKRRFIARIVPLYRQRGTKAGLEEMLRTYTGMGVEVDEFKQPFQVGVTSTVGLDTMIGGGPPHYFKVKLFLSSRAGRDLSRREQIARAIINQEKPAHTYYDLETVVPTMQIGVYSRVGVDTLLGTKTS